METQRRKKRELCRKMTRVDVFVFILLISSIVNKNHKTKEQNGDTETNVIDSWDFIYYWRYPKYKMILFKSKTQKQMSWDFIHYWREKKYTRS
jgi:hypothetical protein